MSKNFRCCKCDVIFEGVSKPKTCTACHETTCDECTQVDDNEETLETNCCKEGAPYHLRCIGDDECQFCHSRLCEQCRAGCELVEHCSRTICRHCSGKCDECGALGCKDHRTEIVDKDTEKELSICPTCYHERASQSAMD